jgi:uncharacterized protein YutE (UPF0331/DUF86 family)
MVGSRKTVVHQYTNVDIRIVETVIASDLNELLGFADKIREYVSSAAS